MKLLIWSIIGFFAGVLGCAHAPTPREEVRSVEPLGEAIAHTIQHHYPKYVMDQESVEPVLERLKKKSYLKYLDPDEQKLEIEESLEWFRDAHLSLRYSNEADKKPTLTELLEINETTAVLKVPSFEAALKQFELVRACQVYAECYIDISENEGGYLDQMALFYVTLFNRDVPQPETFVTVSKDNNIEYFTLNFLSEQLGASAFSTPSPLQIKSLAVVIGPKCRSTCELFSSWVNQSHAAKLVGLPTGGGASSANPMPYKIEGYPFTLDIPKYLRLKSIGEGLFVTSQDSPIQPDIWLTRHQLSRVELMVQAASRHSNEIFIK